MKKKIFIAKTRSLTTSKMCTPLETRVGVYIQLFTNSIVKFVVFLTFIIYNSSFKIYSQNVGINSTGSAPDPSAILDVGDGNSTTGGDTKGMLIPRVALTSITDVTTIPSPATSLVVYNTNATITNGNGAGFYYYNGSRWVYMPTPTNGPGTAGQVLTSQGTGSAPQWQTLTSSASQGGGRSALGTAMMTAYMDSAGLFTPHLNNCNTTTEAFVPLFSGATVGYCIEKNERAAAYWTDAIRTCLAAGKRLPEPWEWQVACDNAGALGLSGMTNNWEWASNFALPLSYGGNIGVGPAVFGAGGCTYANWNTLGFSNGSRGSSALRCVH